MSETITSGGVLLDRGQRLDAVPRDADLEPLIAQQLAEQVGDPPVVLRRPGSCRTPGLLRARTYRGRLAPRTFPASHAACRRKELAPAGYLLLGSRPETVRRSPRADMR